MKKYDAAEASPMIAPTTNAGTNEPVRWTISPVIVGATEIDSEDTSAVSVRSTIELLTAAHSIVPQLAEARIVRLDTHLRPATADQRPHLHCEPGLIRINGLFRHGFLLAPALIEEALERTGLMLGARRKELSHA